MFPAAPRLFALLTVALLATLPLTARTAWFVPGGAFDRADPEFPSFAPYDVRVDGFYLDARELTNAEAAQLLNQALTAGAAEVVGRTIRNVEGDPQILLDLSVPAVGLHYADGRFTAVDGREQGPCVALSWYGAMALAAWRSDAEGLPRAVDLTSWESDANSPGYRLPTEAEWEYAARGGTAHSRFLFAGSQTAAILTWEGRDYTSPVPPPTTGVANALGLVDMSAGVWEWCADWYQENYYPAAARVNPTGPATGTRKVKRGGSWRNPANYATVAHRHDFAPTETTDHLGVRLLRPAPAAATIFVGIKPRAPGWLDDPTFGLAWAQQLPWLGTTTHGWLYLVPTERGFWAWDEPHGWWWSSRDLYPTAWLAEANAWGSL